MNTVIIKDAHGIDVNGIPVEASLTGQTVITSPQVAAVAGRRVHSRSEMLLLALILFVFSCWFVVEAGRFLANTYPPGSFNAYFMFTVQFMFAWGYISFVSHLPPFYDRYYQTVKPWFPQFLGRAMGSLFLVYLMQI
jgi:hypothetical protein